MTQFGNTIVSLGKAKESALYFDHVIPVINGIEELTDYMTAYGTQLEAGQEQSEAIRYGLEFAAIPANFLDSILPPDLANNRDFHTHLLEAIKKSRDAAIKFARDYLDTGQLHLDELFHLFLHGVCGRIITGYDLTHIPIDIPGLFISDPPSSGEAEIAVTLSALNLIDPRKVTWEQILEFRRDKDAQTKLRRLRMFAFENYRGKSKSFIEDDISVRIADYNDAVQKWKFDRKLGAFTSLLNSKILGGALAGTLLSAQLGAPLSTMASASVGVLEIGRIALELRKSHFALRSLMAENPVCYISEAKAKLAEK